MYGGKGCACAQLHISRLDVCLSVFVTFTVCTGSFSVEICLAAVWLVCVCVCGYHNSVSHPVYTNHPWIAPERSSPASTFNDAVKAHWQQLIKAPPVRGDLSLPFNKRPRMFFFFQWWMSIHRFPLINEIIRWTNLSVTYLWMEINELFNHLLNSSSLIVDLFIYYLFERDSMY